MPWGKLDRLRRMRWSTHAEGVVMRVESSPVAQRLDDCSEEEQTVAGVSLPTDTGYEIHAHGAGTPLHEEVVDVRRRHTKEEYDAADAHGEGGDVAIVPQGSVAALRLGVGRTVVSHVELYR